MLNKRKLFEEPTSGNEPREERSYQEQIEDLYGGFSLNVKSFVDAVKRLVDSRMEMKASICQKDSQTRISDPVTYIPFDINYVVSDPICRIDEKKVGLIHSHRTPENRLSFLDLFNPTVQKSETICVVANKENNFKTRCYKLKPEKFNASRLVKYKNMTIKNKRYGSTKQGIRETGRVKPLLPIITEIEAAKLFLEDSSYPPNNWIIRQKEL